MLEDIGAEGSEVSPGLALLLGISRQPARGDPLRQLGSVVSTGLQYCCGR